MKQLSYINSQEADTLTVELSLYKLMTSAKSFEPVRLYLSSQVQDIHPDQVRQFAAIIWGGIDPGEYKVNPTISVVDGVDKIKIIIWKMEKPCKA